MRNAPSGDRHAEDDRLGQCEVPLLRAAHLLFRRRHGEMAAGEAALTARSPENMGDYSDRRRAPGMAHLGVFCVGTQTPDERLPRMAASHNTVSANQSFR